MEVKKAEARLTDPVLDDESSGEADFRLFRYVPWDGSLFFWTLTVEKTVLRNKNVASWESEPHIYAMGQTDI